MNSKQRVIDHGEVYTPPQVVAAMLDLIPHECTRIESRFLEPACGSGNFLVEVLVRKLATVTARYGKHRPRWEHDAVLAVSSLYGIDLLPDNVTACRTRLLEVLDMAHQQTCRTPLPDNTQQAVAFILACNIVQGDAITFRTASGDPVVLAEWSPLHGGRFKRRDFRYSHLLEHAHVTGPGSLFSDEGQAVYLPEPIADFPPCHYLDVPKTGAAA